jgi:hypothetical protein
MNPLRYSPMHRLTNHRFALFLASLLAVNGRAAVASPAKAPPHYGSASENHVFAQILVNELKAGNPELLAMGLHAIPPGSKDEKMIASTDDSIGKLDSAADREVPASGKIVIAPGVLGGIKRYKVLLPLKDAHGNTIGLAVYSIRRDESIGPIKALAVSLAFNDQVGSRVPELAALFKPTQ